MVRQCDVCKKFISNEESIVLLRTKVTCNLLLGEWCSEECYKMITKNKLN